MKCDPSEKASSVSRQSRPRLKLHRNLIPEFESCDNSDGVRDYFNGCQSWPPRAE